MCEKEKVFLELIDGFTWKYDANKYPRSLFGFKNGVCLFLIYVEQGLNQKKFIVKYRLGIEQELGLLSIFVNTNKIWSIFKSDFYMRDHEIKIFIRDMTQKYFKVRVYFASMGSLKYEDWNFRNV